MDELITPFRLRYERSCALATEAQLEECADYLQNPDVLVAEFLESYYWVEGKLDPDRHDAMFEASQEELVLEPYFDSLLLRVDAGGDCETIRCLAGAFAPLPGELHPALEQKGVDYVGVREGSQRIVLGVTDLQHETTGFCLLLRALNCLAELTRDLAEMFKRRVGDEPQFAGAIGRIECLEIGASGARAADGSLRVHWRA